MKHTSDEVPMDRQNLWIIDERLSYHSFLASDLRLKDLKYLESPSAERPDIAVFNHPLAFTDETPITSTVIIEFKKADRKDYRESPVDQTYRLLDRIREGRLRDNKGKAIQPVSENFPAYCYVICDLTPRVKSMLANLGALPTPDGQGYFGYNTPKRAYYEVICYSKLLNDATKRNRALFEKLGLSS